MAMEAFATTNRRDYVWPYPKPVIGVPSQPAKLTQPRALYMRKPDIGSCNCDGHGWNPMFRRYLCLADKEKKLSDELFVLKTELTNITGDVLEHPCDGHDAKMESLYNHDYTKRGFAVPDFTALTVATDAKVGAPIRCQEIGLGNGARDPTSFRYTPMQRPSIDGTRPMTLATTPLTLAVYSQPFPGRSEYQDTISRTGHAVVKTSQQYREPLPSSRRRFGDPCC